MCFSRRNMLEGERVLTEHLGHLLQCCAYSMLSASNQFRWIGCRNNLPSSVESLSGHLGNVRPKEVPGYSLDWALNLLGRREGNAPGTLRSSCLSMSYSVCIPLNTTARGAPSCQSTRQGMQTIESHEGQMAWGSSSPSSTCTSAEQRGLGQ